MDVENGMPHLSFKPENLVLLIKSGVSSLISVMLNYITCESEKGIMYTRRINLKLHKKQGGI